ncbi:unnamed protein product, partial [Urochloa humidicola]
AGCSVGKWRSGRADCSGGERRGGELEHEHCRDASSTPPPRAGGWSTSTRCLLCVASPSPPPSPTAAPPRAAGDALLPLLPRGHPRPKHRGDGAEPGGATICGSVWLVVAENGSTTIFTPGSAPFQTVWQGSGRSRGWSRSRSPAKGGLIWAVQVLYSQKEAVRKSNISMPYTPIKEHLHCLFSVHFSAYHHQEAQQQTVCLMSGPHYRSNLLIDLHQGVVCNAMIRQVV